MQQLPRVAQQSLALRTAELLRSDGAGEAMAGGRRIVLPDPLPSAGQRGDLASQPTQHPPDGGVSKCSLVNVANTGRGQVACRSVAGTGRCPIGRLVLLEVRDGQMEKRRASVTLIGEYENRDNR